MEEHVQNKPLPESLSVLAELLEQYASGSGRITPRPRGTRLHPETISVLETALATAEVIGKVSKRPEELMVFGNGCYAAGRYRSEEHTSELQSLVNLVCRLLLEKKKKYYQLLES